MKLTNKHNLSLPLAVLLSHSDYDHCNDEKTISATGLLKPLRAIILGLQNQTLDKEVDLADLIPSVFGSAVHNFAEQAWNRPLTLLTALEALNVPQDTIKRVHINPSSKTSEDDLTIPIYIERRSERKLGGWTVRGKFDCCVDGKLADYKITSVYGTIFARGEAKKAMRIMSMSEEECKIEYQTKHGLL